MADSSNLGREETNQKSLLPGRLNPVLSAMAVFDERGFCLLINEAGASILESAPGETASRHVHDVVHRHNRSHGPSGCPLLLALTLRMRCEWEQEELCRSDGSTFRARCESVPMFGAQGEIRGFTLTFNVAQTEQTQKTPRRSPQVVEAIDQAVVSVDRMRRVTYWNLLAERLYGVPAAEAIGRDVFDVVRSEDLRQKQPDIVRQLLDGKSWRGEIGVSHPNGRVVRTIHTISPVFDSRRAVTGYVSVSGCVIMHGLDDGIVCEAHERMNSVLECTTDAVFALDPDWRVSYLNPRAEAILGSGLIGKILWSEFPEAAEPQFREAFNRAMMSLEPQAFELLDPANQRWYEVRASRWINGVVVFLRDITDQQRAARELREGQQRFDLLARASHELIWDLDLVSGKVWRSEGYLAALGYSACEVRPDKEWAFEHLHPDDRERVVNSVEKFIASSKTSWRTTYRLRRKNGTYAWIECRAYKFLDEQGRPVRLIAAAMDLTEQKDVERQLRGSRKRLRALSQRLITLQEEERTRIAREIHDELGQALTALRFGVSALPAPEDSRRELTDQIDRTIESIRQTASELRPPLLDALGLIEAARREVDLFQRRTGIACRISIQPAQITVDADRSITVFRILQEALTNVARHSGASNALVGLRKTSKNLILVVEDDGSGISDAELTATDSLGLTGMRERALLLRGDLRIRRRSRGGTRVRLAIPLLNDDEEADEDLDCG